MADYKLLQRLCEAKGISGDEGAVREIIRAEVAPYAETMEVTPLGNLIVTVKGKQPAKKKLMINAHMDEVGFIVTNIREDGCLGFACVGGIDQRVIFGRRVWVAGKYLGVIGGKAVHLLSGEERGKSVPTDAMVIDIGAKDKAEAEALRDDIKNEMLSRNTEELEAGQYIVRWTSVLSQRFDSTAFKKVMPDVYKDFIKQTASRRFSIA